MHHQDKFQSDNEGSQDLIFPSEPFGKQQTICVKNLLSKPIPLMHKVQYTPAEPHNHYPVLQGKLPPSLGNHQLFIDTNNMQLMDQCIFNQQKLKKDIVNCIKNKPTKIHEKPQLSTLHDFYLSKYPIYEKIINYSNHKYFATYLLNFSNMKRGGLLNNNNIEKASFVIRRNAKSSHLTQRSKTQRHTLICRSQIQFNSNFESGNLFKVFQRQFNEFDLILQNDINTKGNNQWFFFSVKNVPRGTNLKFNIVNISKKSSLFEMGMKPAVFSLMKFQKRQIGWVRDGTKINYRQSEELRKQSSIEPYNIMTFQYLFNYDGDIVYFSHSIPYTFTNLTNYLSKTLFSTVYSNRIKVRSIGQTLGGNQINMFQITNKESDFQKKSIWIMARQHPSQTTASFMAEGIIDFLLSDSQQTTFLLNHFIFKIIPMMNVDGVIHGNSRTELLGFDSNRKWQEPSKIYQPIIYAIKKLIQKDNVEMVLDLHSHSKKLGTFFYTNYSEGLNDEIRIFPMMVCKKDERFDYRSNRFRGGSMQTARKVLFDILKVPLVYTVQSSFYGYQKQGDFKITNYIPNDFRQMGANILITFAQMMKKKGKFKNIKLLLCKQEQLQQDHNLWNVMSQVDEIQSNGSDDDPQEDQFSKKQLQILLPMKAPKNKKNKNKKKVIKIKKQKIIQNEMKIEISQVKVKKIDKDSYYKKYFSGRCSLNMQHSENIQIFLEKAKRVETKNMGIQIDLPERNVLNRSNNINLSEGKGRFESKSLFVMGQRVQQQFVIHGNNIGVQAIQNKVFLKNRSQVAINGLSMSRRLKSSRIGICKWQHNQNNFLNKGDILHTALRIFKQQ